MLRRLNQQEQRTKISIITLSTILSAYLLTLRACDAILLVVVKSYTNTISIYLASFTEHVLISLIVKEVVDE